MTTPRPAAPLPATQRAIQFVAADTVVLNPAKPVPELRPDAGPRQGGGRGHLLLRHEAAARLHGPSRARARCRRPGPGGPGRDPQLRARRAADRARPRVLRAHRGRRLRGAAATGSASASSCRPTTGTCPRPPPTPPSATTSRAGSRSTWSWTSASSSSPTRASASSSPSARRPAPPRSRSWSRGPAWSAPTPPRSATALSAGGRLLVVADAGHAIDGLAELRGRVRPAARWPRCWPRRTARALVAELASGPAAESGIAGIVEASRPREPARRLLRRHRLLRRGRRPASRRCRRSWLPRASSTSCSAASDWAGPWRSTSGASTTT